MRIPEPRKVLLFEAAQRVTNRCGTPMDHAKAHLDRAFREHSLGVFDRHGRAIEDWDFVEINWEASSITRRGPSVTYTIEGASVFREHLDAWMADVELAVTTDGRRGRTRGPAPGTLNRYGEADQKLYSELERIMRDDRLSVTAAALRLAEDRKIAGSGAAQSLAKRLVQRYRQHSRGN